MAKRDTRRPTDAELQILQVLWEDGPSTVRQVHDTLAAVRDTGYTTVLKHMQIMMEKGLLERDDDVRPQIYRSARSRQHTQKLMLRDLLDRAFLGSPGAMVLQALSSKKTTSEERRQIRDLLDELEGEA